MSEKNKKRKKNSRRWFSPDSLMGKALCALLVVILTVGAFLAPKLINNLYDAGTLMQITYVDMELSPYAVAYVNFEDKMKAIARASTAEDYFMTLPADEKDEKISDADLVEAVNREMKEAVDGMSVLFFEGWWGELTEESLVSREKNTLYMQPRGSGADNGPYQEAAPIPFWTLTFELTETQMEEEMENRGVVVYVSKEEREAIEKERKTAMRNMYATDRLTVCLDADFYKIYAVAVEGNIEKIWDMYGGLYLPDLFRVVPEGVLTDAKVEQTYGFSEYNDLQMFVTDQIIEGFVEYWEIRPEDKALYEDIPGELSGCAVFPGDGENENEILLEVGCQGKLDSDGILWTQKAGCKQFFDIMQF